MKVGRGLLFVGASLLAATSVQAQSPAASSAVGASVAAVGVDEVVVTAQRRETNLQKTPIAISAFGAKTLEDRRINSIRDLSGQIPNFFIARANISYTTQTYSLRGVGETDPIQEPVVAVYVDDVYQPRQIGSMLDFSDIQRVEVLRGPQGTLYGRNSSAGAIRVITNEPTKTFHTSASLSYGSFNDLEARALVSGPLAGDDLTGSLSYLHRQRDGITHDPTLGHDVNRIHFDAGRAKLRWTPGRWDIEGVLNVLRDRSDSRSYIPANQPGGHFATRTSYSEVPPYQNLDQISGSLRVIYGLTDALKLKSISSYGGFNLDPVNYDNDGQAALIQKNLIHYNDQYYTEELQLNGDYGWVNFSSGLFYLHERFFVRRDGYSRRDANSADVPSPVSSSHYSYLRAHNVTNTDSYAIFGEANWKLTSKLTLTTGVRETYESKRFTFNNSTLTLAGAVVGPQVDTTHHLVVGQASHSWAAFTPKVSLSYQWTPELLQYATYSQGFKSGGYDNRATRLDLAELPFNPEYVNSYETGLKSEFFDHRLRANVAAFYNDYKDLQVSFYDPTYVGTIRGNAGQAHSVGGEAEIDARLTDRLTVQASAGYLYAVYDQYKNAGGLGVNADGHPLINAPRWTVSGGIGYDLPVHFFGTFHLGVDGQWASDFYSSALRRPNDHVPAQGFLNASLGWTSDDTHWSAIVSGRNLLDSQLPVSASYTPSSGILFYNFADPTTLLLTVKYQL